jgi:hypothetical protein
MIPDFFAADDDALDNSGEEFLIEAVEFFQRKYKAASSFKDATIRMTTAEIYDQLQQLRPGGYSEKDVYDKLKMAGFIYDTHASELKLVWCLISKNIVSF